MIHRPINVRRSRRLKLLTAAVVVLLTVVITVAAVKPVEGQEGAAEPPSTCAAHVDASRTAAAFVMADVNRWEELESISMLAEGLALLTADDPFGAGFRALADLVAAARALTWQRLYEVTSNPQFFECTSAAWVTAQEKAAGVVGR